ncbi:MAG: hypothetical protein M3256_21905 [Actinomycetota bacterium]|nr:hypothetical protein [Actinomycetota bacterium]
MSVIDKATNTDAATVPVGSEPCGVAANTAGMGRGAMGSLPPSGVRRSALSITHKSWRGEATEKRAFTEEDGMADQPHNRQTRPKGSTPHVILNASECGPPSPLPALCQALQCRFAGRRPVRSRRCRQLRPDPRRSGVERFRERSTMTRGGCGPCLAVGYPR